MGEAKTARHDWDRTPTGGSGPSVPMLRVTDASPATGHGHARGDHQCAPRNSGERRVGRGLEVAVDPRRVRAFEPALGEHDNGRQVPGGPRARTCPGHRPIRTLRCRRPPGRTPRPAVEEPGQKRPCRPSGGGQLVGGHRCTVSGGRTGVPPRSSIWAKASRSSAVTERRGRLHLPAAFNMPPKRIMSQTPKTMPQKKRRTPTTAGRSLQV
jgi:hypothetical protein